MSGEYTPTIGALKEAWLAVARRAPGQADAFDRAIAGVWDAGHHAGVMNATDADGDVIDNPYRKP